MPLYTVTTQANELNAEARIKLAGELTAFHSEHAGVPKNWVYIVFQDYPPGSGFAAGASCHSGARSIIRKNRSAPAMAVRAWLYWLPMDCTGSKNRLARKKKMTRSPTSMCSQLCGCSVP